MPDLYAIAQGTTRLCRLTHYETRRVRGTEGEYVVAWLDDGSPLAPIPRLLTALRVGTLEDWARWSRREAERLLGEIQKEARQVIALEHGRTD